MSVNEEYPGLESLIQLNEEAPALSPILVDCQKLNRVSLLFTVGNVIGIILERIKRLSPITYDVALLGNENTLGDLPKFENVRTVPDEFAPANTLFVLTMRLNDVDIIRPASYQSWDEYFMHFFRTKEPDRIMITHMWLQARLINCPKVDNEH